MTGKRHSLTSDQVKVSEHAQTVGAILREAMPYVEASVAALKDCDPQDCDPIEVPPQVIRDLGAIVAAEVKRAGYFTLDPELGAREDPGDSDWNPFKGIDFEWD